MRIKNHPVGPHALALLLAATAEALEVHDFLDDMRQYPEIYYSDHDEWSRARGTLPLSERAWRMSCLSS